MSEVATALGRALSGRYTVERELGRGGMAYVFLARDAKHQRPVAIKVLRPELAAALGAERFLREIELTTRLSHPRILAIHDSGSAEGLLYYVMPYVAGESLRDRLGREKQLPIADAVAVTAAICAALDYAHRQGIIHRDIKPENILLADGEALVADFGIARSLATAAAASEQKLTETGFAIGTPAYMSPEQSASDTAVDGRSDEFAVACVLYEMLVGEPPFRGATSQVIAARRATEPMPSIRAVRPTVPLALERAIRKGLEKSPADRFATVRDFADAIARALAGDGLGVEKPQAFGVRKPLGLLSAAGIGVVLAAYAISHRRPAPPAPASGGAVAVLAFDNLTAAPGDSTLATGLAAELATELRRVPGLRVAATASAFSYRGAPVSLDSIARGLDVGRLVTGALRRTSGGDSVRIDAQLVRAGDGHPEWTGHFEARGSPSFALQDSIVIAIVTALQGKMGEQTRRLVVNHGTTDLAAQAAYFRGRSIVSSRAHLEDALAAFDEAIAHDSSYAKAWAGRGDAYTFLSLACCAMAPTDGLPLARAAVLRALQLDPTSPEAHTSLAIILQQGEKNYRAAQAELDTALALDSTYAEAHLFVAWTHTVRLEHAAAIAEAQHALRLSPRSPIISLRVGTMYYLARQYDSAVVQFRRTLELDPAAAGTHNALANTYALEGRCGEALTETAVAAGKGGFFTAPPGYVLAVCNRKDEARRLLEAALTTARSGKYVAAWIIAETYLGLGDRDRFFSWFERAIDAHESLFVTDPVYDPVRADPRFQALLTRWVI